MDYDEYSLNSTPTMGPGRDVSTKRPPFPDEPSLGSAPTMSPDRDASTRRPPSSLGQIDQYQLVRKLGGGGFGVVYLAHDTISGIDVALKTLHPLLKSNPEEMEGLRAKFALVARLSHPNIASPLVLHPCRDIAITDEEARQEMRLSPGDNIMVMRYAPGVTLSKWRKQFPDGVVPPDLALEVARQIAIALDYAHGERIVHRDIKPANVMVETLSPKEFQPSTKDEIRRTKDEGDGKLNRQTVKPSNCQTRIRVRILDFGLAAEIRSSMSRVSTETGDTSGTRPYMAPEQWLGKKQDGRTDQYALACVLYELLSGAPPFSGVFETGDPIIMRTDIERDAPEEIEDLPVHVNAALQKSLAKNPKERFARCTEFVEALSNAETQSALRDSTTEAQRHGVSISSVAKPESRNPNTDASSTAPRRVWPWLLVGAAAVALGVGVWRTGGTSETGEAGGASDEAVPPAAHVAHVPQVAPDAPPVPSDQQAPAATSVQAAQQDPPAASLDSQPAAAQPGGPGIVPAALQPGESAAVPAVASVAKAPDAAIILPPETATRAEMEDVVAQLESRRDALASQEYAADDPERKPVEEAIAVLQSRIDAALEKESLKAREAELAGRRAAAQRTIDLQSLSDLKKAVERRVSSLDATWNDGEFARRRKAIADAQKALANCTDASSLARAKELRGDIYDAVDWIERNTPARAGLTDAEKALDALSRECAAADAATLAAASLRKAERARREAEAKRDSGRYEEAATGYASAKAFYETARIEARVAKAAALVEEARAYGQSKMWEKSLAAAQKALEWDASSTAAQSLRDEAEKNLKPTWAVSATLGGVAVSGATLALGGTTYRIPVRLSLESGKTYGPGEVTLEKDGKTYVGILEKTTVGWLGEKPVPVTLLECTEPKLGERKVVRIGSQEVALRWCPPGTFTMGSPTSEEGRYSDETQHRVTLTKGFWMGETEVTQGLWKEVMGDNPSNNKAGDNYPVENVSWDDCQEFLKKLNSRSSQSGLKWALPTEAQWEYACRAGMTGAYGGTGRLDDMGWYTSNSGNATHPVKGKQPNAWGLHDMHGNVYEWCQDWYGDYPSGAVTDPTGVASGGSRVLRGGGFWSSPRRCRSAGRCWYSPGYRFRILGFRLLAFQDGK